MSVVESNPMLLLADSYAAELSAQFRTLNLFVSHAGEIGRTHEAYLRNVIRRFLPEKYGIGTGFVASGRWISKQQDIIVYNQHDFPLLFKAGDCVVADLDATVGTLEVKTRLNNREDFSEAYTKLCDLYKQIGGLRFVGLYAWEGLNVDTALDTIWAHVRSNVPANLSHMPNAVYVRSQYLLLSNQDGKRESPPFRLIEISDGHATEGQALLTLISEIWMGGAQRYAAWPRWLEDWWRRVPDVERLIPWPDDLLKAAGELV